MKAAWVFPSRFSSACTVLLRRQMLQESAKEQDISSSSSSSSSPPRATCCRRNGIGYNASILSCPVGIRPRNPTLSISLLHESFHLVFCLPRFLGLLVHLINAAFLGFSSLTMSLPLAPMLALPLFCIIGLLPPLASVTQIIYSLYNLGFNDWQQNAAINGLYCHCSSPLATCNDTRQCNRYRPYWLRNIGLVSHKARLSQRVIDKPLSYVPRRKYEICFLQLSRGLLPRKKINTIS